MGVTAERLHGLLPANENRENTASCARILSLDCSFWRLCSQGEQAQKWPSVTGVSPGGTASGCRCLLKEVGGSGVGVFWASLSVAGAGLATIATRLEAVRREGRRGGKLRCRKLQGEMLNKQIFCLFKMIMGGEQESLLKAARQADSSPCFLM